MILILLLYLCICIYGVDKFLAGEFCGKKEKGERGEKIKKE